MIYFYTTNKQNNDNGRDDKRHINMKYIGLDRSAVMCKWMTMMVVGVLTCLLAIIQLSQHSHRYSD